MNAVAQLDLPMALPPIVTPERRATIHERFLEFHRANPHVADLLTRLAREMYAKRGRVGMKACWERLRWEYAVNVEGDGWAALNNDYTSRYARLIAGACPDLADAFEVRHLRAA